MKYRNWLLITLVLILLPLLLGRCRTVVIKDGQSFIIDGNSHHGDWWSEKYPDWERRTFEVFRKHAAGKNVLDVGGWIGPTALYLGRVSRKVWVLEPNLESYDELRKNLQVNGLEKKVTAMRYALTNCTGQVLFCDTSDSMASMVRECENMAMVPAISVEDLFKKIGEQIEFIKIDIEGGERVVIPALEPYFMKHCPVCFISVHPLYIPRNDIKRVITILQKYYKLYHSDGKTPLNLERVMVPVRQNSDCDILCIPRRPGAPVR